MFFTSWQLWEKMTFVLGAAIVLVFLVGWVKLLWMNRYVRKQELVDEEKRLRIQELRNSGQIVESRKSFDIPFGVRAIQSGIQVDGIWQSHPATPIPNELKDLESGGESVGDVKSGEAGTETSPRAVRPTSRHNIYPSKGKQPSSTLLSHYPETHVPASNERPAAAANRTSYKPQRSSHLRYGSHGEFDADTLGQLEGRSQPKRKSYARPRGPKFDKEMDSSSAADNERSSGASSDSDATLSQRKEVERDVDREQSRDSMLREPLIHTAASTSSPRSSAGNAKSYVSGQRKEYTSVPTESPNYETLDPFATPLSTPPIVNPVAAEASWATNEPLAQTEDFPFISGELHANKSVRKVNSGFEVLPAGTFGAPDPKGKGREYDQEEAPADRRQSTKLQKRPRNSMTGRRESSNVERP